MIGEKIDIRPLVPGDASALVATRWSSWTDTYPGAYSWNGYDGRKAVDYVAGIIASSQFNLKTNAPRDDRNTVYYGAEVGGQLVGYAKVAKPLEQSGALAGRESRIARVARHLTGGGSAPKLIDPNLSEVLAFDVLPDFRGHGIGSQVLAASLEKVISWEDSPDQLIIRAGLPQWLEEVGASGRAEHIQAKAFFESVGFSSRHKPTEVGHFPDAEHGPLLAVYHYANAQAALELLTSANQQA